MAKSDLTNIIERLDAFEGRARIRLEALAAFLIDYDGEYEVQVLGELHPADGTSVENDVRLALDVYDSSGRLVGGDSTAFGAENFYGFDTFEITARDPTSKLSKVRSVPRLEQA